MLITCPTCASSYRIDAAKIGPEGKSVRCAACRETWFITPDAAEEEAPEAALATQDEAPSDPVADAAWEEATAAVRDNAVPEGDGADKEPAPRKRKPPAKKPPPGKAGRSGGPHPEKAFPCRRLRSASSSCSPPCRSPASPGRAWSASCREPRHCSRLSASR
ncbi:zinc-ribbon domain-containing protein [Methylobacterium persicinum]